MDNFLPPVIQALHRILSRKLNKSCAWLSSVKKDKRPVAVPDTYPMILEFSLKSQETVDATYHELTDCGYQGYRGIVSTPVA